MLELGVHTNDITPRAGDASRWMAGYGWGPRRSDGTWAAARPLRAQCAVIWDDGFPNVLLRIDVATIARSVHDEVRRRVVEEERLVGYTADFLMAASHTHSGPCVGASDHLNARVSYDLQPGDIAEVDAYTSHYVDQLVDTVREAIEKPRVPVTLHYAEGETHFSVNRTGLGQTLPRVHVLAARSSEDGELVAVLFGHACHPVSRGSDTVYDSDHCGFAAERIEAQLGGVPALYFQGAAGDLNPAGLPDPNAVVWNGAILAGAVLQTLETDAFTAVTGPLRNTLEWIEVPLAVDTTDVDARAELRAGYVERLDTLIEDDSGNSAARRHAELMIRQIDDGTLEAAVPMPVQCWRLGGLTILGLGHEVCSGYDIGLHQRVDAPLWVMAYVNEVALYIAADDLLWIPSYEGGGGSDSHLAAVGQSLIPYTWPCPLRASPNDGTAPPDGTPGSAPRTVMDACTRILTS
jgi:neutral ceramidase